MYLGLPIDGREPNIPALGALIQGKEVVDQHPHHDILSFKTPFKKKEARMKKALILTIAIAFGFTLLTGLTPATLRPNPNSSPSGPAV